jgi:hypothetical protein
MARIVGFAGGAFINVDQGGAPSAPVLLGNIPNLRERQNSGSHQLDTGSYFSGATSYAIDPAVEAGWSFDTGTGLLTWDTDAVATFGTYIVTATNAQGDTPSNAFSLEVYAVATNTGGSAKRQHRKRYYVEIDGQYFEVNSQAEAEQQILERALSLATEVAEQASERSIKRVRRGKQAVTPSLPSMSSSPELAPIVDEYRKKIDAIYRQIAIDAEIRELMRVKFAEQDEEEAIFVLLH